MNVFEKKVIQGVLFLFLVNGSMLAPKNDTIQGFIHDRITTREYIKY
jgi:hypothetical protein